MTGSKTLGTSAVESSPVEVVDWLTSLPAFESGVRMPARTSKTACAVLSTSPAFASSLLPGCRAGGADGIVVGPPGGPTISGLPETFPYLATARGAARADVLNALQFGARRGGYSRLVVVDADDVVDGVHTLGAHLSGVHEAFEAGATLAALAPRARGAEVFRAREGPPEALKRREREVLPSGRPSGVTSTVRL